MWYIATGTTESRFDWQCSSLPGGGVNDIQEAARTETSENSETQIDTLVGEFELHFYLFFHSI